MNDLAELLQDFHRDKLAELLRHQAGARHIRQYDLNNTYQYFVNRDDVHLSWVEKMTNTRHRGMLRVILGEVLEQKRSFEQVE